LDRYFRGAVQTWDVGGDVLGCIDKYLVVKGGVSGALNLQREGLATAEMMPSGQGMMLESDHCRWQRWNQQTENSKIREIRSGV
jgi:hypothetical protein